MRVTEHEQRSQGWLDARLGIPTASGFGRIITAGGKRSAQIDSYVDQLVAERLTGEQEQVFVTPAMERGTELEPQAREYYEMMTGERVFEIGLCLHDSIDAGASPDGLVGDDGILEIKCPSGKVMVEYLRQQKLPDTYRPQVMGQLWVTEREWCDFLAWHPHMVPFLVRVFREDEYIAELAALVSEVVERVQFNVERFGR